MQSYMYVLNRNNYTVWHLCIHLLAKPNPPAVNVLDMFKNQSDSPWTKDMCPFINTKQYLTDLAEHVAIKKPKFVKIIIGPKDVGKSTGIEELNLKWKELGYVVDLNLKGTSHSVNGKKAMKLISKQLMKLITP